MFEKAKWTAYPLFDAPLATKKFTAGEGKASLAVCGLGWYEAYINGRRVGEGRFFQPAQSDYHPRDLSSLIYPVGKTSSCRMYYNVFDVTEYLREGENEISFLLGNGWYRQKMRRCEGDTSYSDSLKLIFELSFGDGTKVFSDGSLSYTESFIRRNNVYFGETQDFSPVSGAPAQAEEVPAPEALLLEQPCPPDEAYAVLPCKKLHGNIYDAGQNGAGRLRFVAARDAEKITVRYAEELYPDGTPDFSTTSLGSSQIQTDEFLHVGKGRLLAPHFTWHGFRYAQIEGEAENVTAEFIATRREVTSDFRSDVPALDWLYRASLQTLLSNVHGGVPSDCPHRERLGYTGDGQLVAETALLFTDCVSVYEKWLSDILDGQEPDGRIQHTAPFEGGGGGPSGWGGAVVLVPYRLYLATGETSAAQRVFPAMKKWIDYMLAATEDGLVVREREKGWCLGEWCTPDKLVLEEPFVNTCLFVRILGFFGRLCERLGKPYAYADREALCRAAIKRRYYDAERDSYGGGRQGADLFAFAAGLGDERAKRRVEKYYLTHPVDTGIFGTELLFDFLAERGRRDIIFKLFTEEGYPSYGYMREKGATTLWETWRGDEAVSHNHPMFASPAKHLFYSVAGICPDAASKSVRIFPRFSGAGRCRCRLRLFGSDVSLETRFEGKRLAYIRVETDGKREVSVCLGKRTYRVEKMFERGRP